MRIKARIIIIVAVIAVLLASIFLLSKFSGSPENVQENNAEDSSVQVLNVSSEIKSFSVKNTEEGYTVVYENGSWYCPENTNIYLDQEYISNMVNTVKTLTAVPVEEGAVDLSKYGIGDSSVIFEFTDEGDNVYTVKFGTQSPTESGYYSVVNGKNDVHIVSVENYNMLTGNINTLRNKTVLQINSDEVYGIAIKNKENNITIFSKSTKNENAHSNTAWEMIEPYVMDVNQTIFEENVLNVLTFEVSEFVDDNPSDYGIYGLDNPQSSISVLTNSGMAYKVIFGNNYGENLIYMQIEGFPNVYAINKDSVKYLEYSPVYLMESLVFSRMIIKVDNIVFNYDEQYVFKIDGEKFYMNGKSVDEDSFRGVYLALISSRISGEITEKPGKEICNFTFNYNNGTASEKVTFYEYGDMYAAVDVNGTMNFYVMRSYVDDMINEVKKLAE